MNKKNCNINNIEVFGFKKALEGLRLSYNSIGDSYIEDGKFILGKKDLSLVKNLVKKGESHRKFLRLIHIQADVKMPLFWWKQFDQYKVSTTTLSESTMHTLMKSTLTLDNFDYTIESNYIDIIDKLNDLIEKYQKLKDIGRKTIFYSVIELLPGSFLQKRIIDINYETFINIYYQRKNHKLDEWKYFIGVLLENLPYMNDIINKD